MRPIQSWAREGYDCEIYIDGASRGNPGPAGIGVVIFGGEAGQLTTQISRYIGCTTNNVAEYSAMIAALQEAGRAGCRVLLVHTDSELLVRQITGVYRVRDPALRQLHQQVCRLQKNFQTVTVQHVPRARNRMADRLAGDAVNAYRKQQLTIG